MNLSNRTNKEVFDRFNQSNIKKVKSLCYETLYVRAERTLKDNATDEDKEFKEDAAMYSYQLDALFADQA